MGHRLAGAIFASVLVAGLSTAAAAESATQTETIVIMRHGERADHGLGQLSCQGLNRALALPARLAKLFSRPDYLFAPDPAKEKDDFGKPYSYVRPLATIEPTAILLGLPVDATIGYPDIAKLERRLDEPLYQRAIVVVAWEHHRIETLARDLLEAHGGSPKQVPEWGKDDYDGLFVVRINREGGKPTSTFERLQQGLSDLPTACPAPVGGTR